jgi:hypothetical protein
MSLRLVQSSPRSKAAARRRVARRQSGGPRGPTRRKNHEFIGTLASRFASRRLLNGGSMALTQKQTEGWIQRRRERKRLKLERTGDSPQKKSEPARKAEGPDVEDAAQQASTGLLANGGCFPRLSRRGGSWTGARLARSVESSERVSPEGYADGAPGSGTSRRRPLQGEVFSSGRPSDPPPRGPALPPARTSSDVVATARQHGARDARLRPCSPRPGTRGMACVRGCGCVQRRVKPAAYSRWLSQKLSEIIIRVSGVRVPPPASRQAPQQRGLSLS